MGRMVAILAESVVAAVIDRRLEFGHFAEIFNKGLSPLLRGLEGGDSRLTFRIRAPFLFFRGRQ
jgi:hypothetical protein